MFNHFRMGVCVLVTLLAGSIRAQETAVESRVQSVAMFKNGLAIVKRTVDLTAAGTYRVADIPNPVHGTLWIESAVPVSVTSTWREVNAPPQKGADADFQTSLAGKTVTIQLRDGNLAAITGQVVELGRAQGDRAWSRSYQPGSPYASAGSAAAAQPGRYIVIQTRNGLQYIDSGMIASLLVESADKNIRQRLPVLLLSGDGQKAPGAVTISYLAKGIGWAPSYRLNLNDAKSLTIEQQAVVKNEMDDLRDAELSVISGYPNIPFSHVTSPLSVNTNWAAFFAQLNQRPGREATLISNSVLQSAGSNRRFDSGDGDISATPTGEGADVHFQSIGKRTLAEGDALSTFIAKGQADYEPLVEWVVPDNRDASGRVMPEAARNQDPNQSDDAWDAVQFRNPLTFPMTTGPVMVTSGGRFSGQCLTGWVNAGEQTTLRITKALSVRTISTERETGRERDATPIGGRTYSKVTVQGELRVNNHRKEEIKLLVRRQFSGELVSADAEPKKILREEGASSVNPRNELNWSMTLKPGEDRVLNYKYTVLAAF